MDVGAHLRYTSKTPPTRWVIEAMLERVLETVESVAGGERFTALDAACGIGIALHNLSRHHPHADVVGFDIDAESLRVARALVPSAALLQGDIYSIPLEDDSQDVVLCSEVLEHLNEPEAALSELVRVCRGTLILTVPNGYLYRLMLLPKFPSTFGNQPTHVNEWTRSQFREWLLANGVKAQVSTVLHLHLFAVSPPP
jgi:ubiquinone/menaquinone biosynthesis C-methylase UbiE